MERHARKLVTKLLKKRDEEINIHEVVTLCALDVICGLLSNLCLQIFEEINYNLEAD